MSTRTRNRRRNPQAAKPERPQLTLVDLRHPLPIRTPDAPWTAAQMAEARAARVAAEVGLRVPVMAWRSTPDLVAYARFADGTILTHTGGRAPFTAYVPCLLGSHHQHPVTGPALLHAARVTTGDCTTRHADFTDWPAPDSPDVPPRNLAEAFTARYDAETTMSMVLPLQQAKGHPNADA